MKKQTQWFSEKSTIVYFGVFAVFCALLLFFDDPKWGAIGFAVLLLEYVLFREADVRRRREVLKYFDNLELDTRHGKSDTIVSAPFPTVVIRVDTGTIVWASEEFYAISGRRRRLFEVKLRDVVPEADLRWLLEGKKQAPGDLTINNRLYSVYGTPVRFQLNRTGIFAALYFLDVTDDTLLKQRYVDSRPVIMTIFLDNIEELTTNLSEKEKNVLLGEVDGILTEWLEGSQSLIRREERARYFVVMENHTLQDFIAAKFSIIERVHSITSNGLPVTLSIGIGEGGNSFEENTRFSQIAIDMALSRGGDQAVIKNSVNFDFYGGHTPELAKRTKVKSRVMANALRQLIIDSDEIIIMGHKRGDLDAIGAAAGVACICRGLGRPAYIAVNKDTVVAHELINRLRTMPEYEKTFVQPLEALNASGPRSLLIVVDVNRTDHVESEELLASCTRIAVIDHHRRSASYIDNAALNFHEPYASSTSELVTELLTYFGGSKLLKPEAEALLAGIVLDTKSFTMHTGVRTFEAAATLRLAGADTTDIKRLFQTDFDSCMERYAIVEKAVMYKHEIMISMLEHKADRTVAAQAADELLNIQGVQASFVLFPEDDYVIISARSLGKVNVQLILEKLGGGGHMLMAGAQIKGVSTENALSDLYRAIDEVLGAGK